MAKRRCVCGRSCTVLMWTRCVICGRCVIVSTLLCARSCCQRNIPARSRYSLSSLYAVLALASPSQALSCSATSSTLSTCASSNTAPTCRRVTSYQLKAHTLSMPCKLHHRRGKRGRQGARAPPPKKKWGKYFSGNYYEKLGHFSGKNHVIFRNFVNFSGKYHKKIRVL